MRTDRTFAFRGTALATMAVLHVPLFAQEAVAKAPSAPLFAVDMTLIYAMTGLAVVQVIFILSLSGIMRTMSNAGAWAKRKPGSGGRAAILVPLFLLTAGSANAQAYKGGSSTMSSYELFWLLLVVNVLLFILMLAQLNLLRGLTKVVTGVEDSAMSAAPKGPTWADKLMAKLTRQVSVEREQDILMHHEYDGIRELDNVLPPWWVWLFYGSIIWSVVYLFGVHVADFIPDQRTEYVTEMTEAKADVAAYMATMKSVVDENTVTLSTEPADLASGAAIFNQYCTPCHGADAAGSETSVGPNLTDSYWLHGGGVKNVFATIKNGVPEKGMISWKAQLKPVEIAAVASYILSLQGTGPATQKAPQGDVWSDATAPADTTGTVPAPPADTMRVAAQ